MCGRSANRSARSAFRPTLRVSGNAGAVAGHGRQDLLKNFRTGGETWDAQFNRQWNVFDGHARRERLAQPQSARTEAQARLETSRNEAADRVWMAYANARTFRLSGERHWNPCPVCGRC